MRQPAMNEGAGRAPAMSLSERAGPLRLAAAVPVRQLRLVLAGAMLVMVLAALDQNIVNTALPRMASELGGLQHLSWVVAAFMLTSTATTPLYGKLSDMYGRRALFVMAIVVFLGGSLLCGTARSMPQLIGFRALQGLGAGGLLVLAQSAVGDVVSPRNRPRYQGWFSGAFASRASGDRFWAVSSPRRCPGVGCST